MQTSTIVAKFGGSSVATAAQCRKVRDIIVADPARRLVVVSAPGKASASDTKVTDLLIAVADAVTTKQPWDAAWQRVVDRVEPMIAELQLSNVLPNLCADIAQTITNTPTRDFIVSRGEYLQARIMAAYLTASGHPAHFVDAMDCIRFTTEGALDYAATVATMQIAAPAQDICVIPGFYGADSSGVIHVFSRGGSDITGALVACALGAPTYENWTDVSGFYSAHPALVPAARPIPAMTYQEARALSYAGATVLHQETVAHLVANNVMLHVRNTNAPDEPGTRISARCADTATHVGIAGKAGFLIFSIEKMMMNDEVGFGRRVLSIFEDFGISYDHQVTGIDTLSLIVDQSNFPAASDAAHTVLIEQLTAAIHATVAPDRVTVQPDVAVMTIVARAHGSSNGLMRYVGALAGAQIDTISTSQEVSGQIISIVAARDLAPALQAIHHEFFS